VTRGRPAPGPALAGRLGAIPRPSRAGRPRPAAPGKPVARVIAKPATMPVATAKPSSVARGTLAARMRGMPHAAHPPRGGSAGRRPIVGQAPVRSPGKPVPNGSSGGAIGATSGR
jgi:hypothetical protein